MYESAGRGGRRPGAGAPRRNLNALRNGLRARRLAAIYRAASPPSRRMIAAALIATTARELANSRSAGERRHARERGLRRTVELLTLARIDPRTSPAARHLAIVRALAPAFEP